MGRLSLLPHQLRLGGPTKFLKAVVEKGVSSPARAEISCRAIISSAEARWDHCDRADWMLWFLEGTLQMGMVENEFDSRARAVRSAT